MAAPEDSSTFIEATTIGDLIDRAASRSGGDALVFPDARITWPELSRRTDEVARSLAGLGVGPGSTVGILMHNCLDFALLLIATAKLGAVVVPINGRYKVHELSLVIEHSDIGVLATAAGAEASTAYPALLGQVFPDLEGQDPERLRLAAAPQLRLLVDLGDGPAAPGFLDRARFEAAGESVALAEVKTHQERVRIRDVAMLMYTSGTTARPKGCLLTHEALVRHGINIARNNYFMTAEDVFWNPLPLFHIGGIVPILSCASVPAKYVHAGHFDADVAIRQLEEERATILYPTFETIWLAILDHPRFEEADLTSIRLIHNVGVKERLMQMQDRMPWAVQVTAFGMTECSSHLTFPALDDPYEVRMTTLGRPLRGLEVKILDPESGEERAPGEVGELCYRGYSRFEAYHKDPELTAASMGPGGFFRSGDLARADPDGRLVYAGRLKDMLKVGGENVSALEVEDFVAKHPSVQIVQVVAAPDAKYVEVPAAFVQLRAGAAVAEEELVAFCVGQIASYKVPRYVRFVDEWPMSGTKIQKFVLRERIAKELEASGITEAPRISSTRGAEATT